MELLLNILSDNVIERIDNKRFIKAPYSVQKIVDIEIENYALYKYALQDAQRYPMEWIQKHVRVQVMLNIVLKNNTIAKTNINILEKSNALSHREVEKEVYKTIALAKNNFPMPSQSSISLDIPLSWAC